MKEYDVRIPVVGIIWTSVEADSEKEAIAKGMEVEWDIRFDSKNGELEELDLCERIVEGNVCYASLFRAEAEEAGG